MHVLLERLDRLELRVLQHCRCLGLLVALPWRRRRRVQSLVNHVLVLLELDPLKGVGLAAAAHLLAVRVLRSEPHV